MASYKNDNIPITIVDGFDDLYDQIHLGIFVGAEDGTRISYPGGGGGLDPFTGVASGVSEVWTNISGIVGHINEEDSLLGVDGRVRVGMMKVTYHYPSISGIIMEDLQAVQVLTPNVSGLYYVKGIGVDTVADKPIFVDLALGTDRDG